MSSNLQSIVCCLGDPVAGNPTQFLMQRAAASLGMDWMFVTAEVPEDRLSDAFQGIRALKFSGVAFLSPHQQAASTLVDSLTESALRSGHVRVARRDGDAWLGDDTLGMAIVELLINNELNFQPSRDSLAHHDTIAAQDQPANRQPASSQPANDPKTSTARGLLCTGLEWMPHLIRLARPDWSSRIYQWDAKSEAPQRVTSELVESISSERIQAGEDTLASDGVTSSCSSFDIFVIDSTSPPITTKQLSKIVGAAGEITAIFVHHNAAWEAAIQKLDVARKHVFRSFDVAAAKAAVNFQFWTGQPPEFASIRDSLDEYCQW